MEVLLGGVEEGGDAGGGGDVGLDGDCVEIGSEEVGGLGGGGGDVVEDDFGAEGVEVSGDSAADSAGCAGDDC